eukprot:9483617-Heterocapsa_arctica.AAC.1
MLERALEAQNFSLKLRFCAKLSAFCEEYYGDSRLRYLVFRLRYFGDPLTPFRSSSVENDQRFVRHPTAITFVSL